MGFFHCRGPVAALRARGPALAALLALLLLLQGPASPLVAGDDPPPPSREDDSREAEGIPLIQSIDSGGISLRMEVRPLRGGDPPRLVVGEDAEIRFVVTDAHTGEPLTGLHPLAWIHRRETAHKPNDAELKDLITSFLGGLLSVRADIDLNAYYVLLLNHDGTVSVVDPQISFNITKLKNLINLPGEAWDWALGHDRNHLYVSIPEEGVVAVVDLTTNRLAGSVSVGQESRPMRVVVQPGGRRVWVGLDKASAVAVIDAGTHELLGKVPAGEGMHGIAFGDDGHLAFVTSSGANTVTVIDGETLEPVADIPVGRTPLAVAYSRAADLVYVANINDEHLSVIDPSSKSAVGKISTERGTVALRFDPEGRFGFIVNQTAGLVSVLDVATNSIVGGTSVVSEPDQVTFTEKFAYIRNLGSNKITMIDRDRLAREQVVVVDVMIGQKPPVDLPAQIGVADMIVPTPTVGSVMIASAPDRSFYYYAEGMMASMGSFQAYKRFPRGILILDRSLQESAPGVYSTFIRPLRSGLCNVPCVVDQPRVVHCFELRVEAAEGEAAAPTGASVTVKYLFDKPRIRPGGDTKLTFRVLDSATGAPVEGLEDILVMIFKKPGVWQRRQRAKEIGDGAYEIVQSFPESGMHMMLVSIPSRGASFLDLPTVDLPVYTDEEGPRW